MIEMEREARTEQPIHAAFQRGEVWDFGGGEVDDVEDVRAGGGAGDEGHDVSGGEGHFEGCEGPGSALDDFGVQAGCWNV
jgi:hypothetical protein